MKLNTKKYLAFFTFCLIICFIFISIFGIHSRFGDTVSNHFKGWENLKFGQDFDNHTEMVLKSSNPKIKLNDENLIETINDRLQALGFTDNKIAINEGGNQLILKFTQPAGIPDFDPQTIEHLIGSKGVLSISSSNQKPDDKDAITITNSDIKGSEIITRQTQQMFKKSKPEYGLKIKLNSAGTKKLETLTKKMVAENEKIQKENKQDKQNTNSPAKLNITFDQNDITKAKNDNSPMSMAGGLDVTEPITDGQIEIFNDANLYDLKILSANLNEKPLPDFFYIEKLQKVSPNLGMWFKRITIYSLLIIISAIIFVLILKFKLIGIVCSVCLLGHFCFILACFTGFFSIYPGAIFNFAALIGTTLSALIGVKACFLIGKKTKSEFKHESNQQFTSDVKNGLNKSLRIISIWNHFLAITSLVLMAIFSYKTNTIVFILKPIYNLLGLNLVYSSSIASLAYAVFAGSIGSLFFEIFLLKFIATSITSQKININFKKYLNFTKKIFKKINFNFIKFRKKKKTKKQTKSILPKLKLKK